MDNTSTLLCNILWHSFEDGYLTTIYTIQMVVCVALIPPAIVLCIAIAKATVLHRNVRICLVNLTISTVITNVGTAFIAGYHLWAVCGSAEQFCGRLLLTSNTCGNIEMIRNFGALMTVGGLLFLAAERVCATIQFKTYEKSGSTIIGIGLAAIQWLASTPALLRLVKTPKKHEGEEIRHPYCNGVTNQPHTSSIYFYFMFSAQIIGLFIFIILAFINKRKMNQYNFNHALRLLSVRYQLKENVNTTKFMIPISACSSLVLGITIIALMIFVRQLPSDSSQQLSEDVALQHIQFARIMELISLSPPAFTVGFIFVVMRYSIHIRQNVKTMFGWIKPPGRVTKVGCQIHDTQTAKDQYFNALKKQWQMPNAK